MKADGALRRVSRLRRTSVTPQSRSCLPGASEDHQHPWNVKWKKISPNCIAFTGYSKITWTMFLEGFEDFLGVEVSKVPNDCVVILEGPMKLAEQVMATDLQEIPHKFKPFMCDIRRSVAGRDVTMRTAYVKRCTQPKHVTSQLMQKARITPCASKEMTAVDLERLKKYLEKEYDKKHTRCTLRVQISLCKKDHDRRCTTWPRV